MQSYFEINVAFMKLHLFATAPRSLTERNHAMQVLAEIMKRFPEEEGYLVTCTHWQVAGYQVQA